MLRLYLHETDAITPPSVFYQPARSASERLTKLMGSEVFDFPKDELVLQKFIEMAAPSSKNSEIILDFFAGSGTTAHAVLSQNAQDSGNRRYILVQLPEKLSLENREQEAAAKYCDAVQRPRLISELTKERLRKSSMKVRSEYPLFSGDTGFRVFKLDTSNVKSWNPNPQDISGTLLENLEHIVSGRSSNDVLYEALIKLGLDLSVSIEKQEISGKSIHSIGGGSLIACLDEHINVADAEPLALGIVALREEQKTAGETTALFRDSAFENDVAKSNLAAILEQHGIKQVRSL